MGRKVSADGTAKQPARLNLNKHKRHARGHYRLPDEAADLVIGFGDHWEAARSPSYVASLQRIKRKLPIEATDPTLAEQRDWDAVGLRYWFGRVGLDLLTLGADLGVDVPLIQSALRHATHGGAFSPQENELLDGVINCMYLTLRARSVPPPPPPPIPGRLLRTSELGVLMGLDADTVKDYAEKAGVWRSRAKYSQAQADLIFEKYIASGSHADVKAKCRELIGRSHSL